MGDVFWINPCEVVMGEIASMERPGKQKPRLGWLYVVCHDNAPDLVKIGETDRPIERMRELDNPTILARVPVMSAYDKEQLLHRRFKLQ